MISSDRQDERWTQPETNNPTKSVRTSNFPSENWNPSGPGRGYIPKTRHKVVFEIPLPQSTVSDCLHTDKNALRDRIVALRAEGLSYREIAKEIGLHWTRVGQILKSHQSR